jgi:hypothetical protein
LLVTCTCICTCWCVAGRPYSLLCGLSLVFAARAWVTSVDAVHGVVGTRVVNQLHPRCVPLHRATVSGRVSRSVLHALCAVSVSLCVRSGMSGLYVCVCVCDRECPACMCVRPQTTMRSSERRSACRSAISSLLVAWRLTCCGRGRVVTLSRSASCWDTSPPPPSGLSSTLRRTRSDLSQGTTPTHTALPSLVARSLSRLPPSLASPCHALRYV